MLHALCSYEAIFKEYALAWYSELTTAERQNLRVSKQQGQVRFPAKSLLQALGRWPAWVVEQQHKQQEQQQQQELQQRNASVTASSRGRGGRRGRARASASAATTQQSAPQLQLSHTLEAHSSWADCMQNARLGGVIIFAEASVKQGGGQTVRVTQGKHRRADEFSWVLLFSESNLQAGGMTFFKVSRILQHTDGTGLVHTVLSGDQHSSVFVDGQGRRRVDVDPFIGMPVISAQPDRPQAGGLPAGHSVGVPCQQAVYNVSVLEHPSKPGKLVCLARQPQAIFTAAGQPTPGSFT